MVACSDHAAPVEPESISLSPSVTMLPAPELPVQANGLRYQVFTPDQFAAIGFIPPSLASLRSDVSAFADGPPRDCDSPVAVIDCDGNPNFPPPGGGDPPPPPSSARFDFGSRAVRQGDPSPGLKQVYLTSFSEAIQNVTTFSLDASFRNAGGSGPQGCGVQASQFDSSHFSGTGSPGLLQSSRVANWVGTIKWEVVGDHRFRDTNGNDASRESRDSICQ